MTRLPWRGESAPATRVTWLDATTGVAAEFLHATDFGCVWRTLGMGPSSQLGPGSVECAASVAS